MATPLNKEPAEGSREVVDKELKRQDRKEAGSSAEKEKPEQKGPAQPRNGGLP